MPKSVARLSMPRLSDWKSQKCCWHRVLTRSSRKFMLTETALAGQRILVTRPRAQSEKLVSMLRESGSVPIQFPVISIEPVPATQWQVDNLEHCDWLIFVSRNAV